MTKKNNIRITSDDSLACRFVQQTTGTKGGG